METENKFSTKELANLLILYLKQNNLYDYSREKTHVREVVISVSDPIDTYGTLEYDVVYKQSITVNDADFHKSCDKTVHLYDYPKSALLYEGEIDWLDFSEELKNNKEFLDAIMKINNLTPLELLKNASSIRTKQKIAILDKQIADLEEQIYHHTLKAKLNELVKERERLIGGSYASDENYEKYEALNDSLKKFR